MRSFLLWALLFAVGQPAWAADTPAPAIVITRAWARPTLGALSTGVVYLTATDQGAPDRLVAASTPIAASATLHESKTVDGIMQMRAVDALPIAPDQPLTLAPNGLHLMLTGLKAPLKAGDHFPLTLTFEHAGQVSATVNVEAMGTSMPMDGMKMDHM